MTSGLGLQPSVLERVHSSMAEASLGDLDAGLMFCVRDGDAHCFAALLNRHRNSLVHFLFRTVQNRAIAEELAQEVFLRVFRYRASYEPSAKFTTWLFRIATNVAFNWLRDGRNERLRESLYRGDDPNALRALLDHHPSVESVLVHKVKLDEIRGAIARLPDKQRSAVLMHKYEEMEYSQIAEVLGCTEAAVKSLLFRAYETLRASLAHYA